MSTSMFIHSFSSRLRIERCDNTVWIRATNAYGYQTESIALTLTSSDRDALIAALQTVDTSAADEDAEIEVAA